MKDNDVDGWKSGNQPRVRLTLRKGEAGVDDPEREREFPKRDEADWPLPRTEYTKFYLTPENTLSKTPSSSTKTVEYDALKGYADLPLMFNTNHRTNTWLRQGSHSVSLQVLVLA